MEKVKYKKGLLITLLILAFFLFVRFVLGGPEDTWLCADGQWLKHGNPNSPQPTSVCGPIKRQEGKIIGVVRSGGLTKEEKTKLGLAFSDYQLTDFPPGPDTDLEIYGYFLESNSPEIKDFLGKCVEIKGRVKPGWEKVTTQKFNLNNQYTFQRLAFIAEEIKAKDYFDCGINTEFRPIDRTAFKKLEVITGTLDRTLRPAPDIAYDYQLKLDKPYADYESSTGRVPEYYQVLDISPYNNFILVEFEKFIDQKVQIEGEMVWGYAESRYLTVISLEKVK